VNVRSSVLLLPHGHLLRREIMNIQPPFPYLYAPCQPPPPAASWLRGRSKTIASRIASRIPPIDAQSAPTAHSAPAAADLPPGRDAAPGHDVPPGRDAPPATDDQPPVFPRLARLNAASDRCDDDIQACNRMLSLLNLIKDSDTHSERVVNTRLAISEETYENALKIEIAVDRLLADLEALPEPAPTPPERFIPKPRLEFLATASATGRRGLPLPPFAPVS